MSKLVTLPAEENTSRASDAVSVSGDTMIASVRREIPFVVPREQLYYWTRSWQDGEAEALAELAAGDSETFSDGDSAARWLLSDDED